MANSKELFRELVNKITLTEPIEEKQSIVYLVLEHQLALSKADIIAGKELTAIPRSRLEEIIERINQEEPVQYILGEADFYGRKFFVDPSVLIPRPETELIVEEVLSYYRDQPEVTIVDIGTGTGCLAVTLAKELDNPTIYATDVSAAALMTAVENAKRNKAIVSFVRHDILSGRPLTYDAEVVVSNPPYITLSERAEMKKNVTAFEPPEALFVADEDPLRFYAAIARSAQSILRAGGRVFVEINERFGQEVSGIFAAEAYRSIRVAKDLNGKDRIVIATK